MVYFIGAGPGAPDLITVRGKAILERADAVVYAGSLVNEELLKWAGLGCDVFDSSRMTLEETTGVCVSYAREGKCVARLHSGDPSLYGAVREQMDALDEAGIAYECVPGVSSFLGAAAAIKAEYTLPGVSQSLIICRHEGRTPVPEGQSVRELAAHGASMAVFLSASMAADVALELMEGGYPPGSPAAIIYRATWPDEKVIMTTVEKLPEAARENGVDRTALLLVGGFLGRDRAERSKLYDPAFSHGCRKAEVSG